MVHAFALTIIHIKMIVIHCYVPHLWYMLRITIIQRVVQIEYRIIEKNEVCVFKCTIDRHI